VHQQHVKAAKLQTCVKIGSDEGMVIVHRTVLAWARQPVQVYGTSGTRPKQKRTRLERVSTVASVGSGLS
jgi:hypothetical protein